MGNDGNMKCIKIHYTVRYGELVHTHTISYFCMHSKIGLFLCWSEHMNVVDWPTTGSFNNNHDYYEETIDEPTSAIDQCKPLCTHTHQLCGAIFERSLKNTKILLNEFSLENP